MAARRAPGHEVVKLQLQDPPFGLDKPLQKCFPGIPIDQRSATWMRFHGGAQTRRKSPRSYAVGTGLRRLVGSGSCRAPSGGAQHTVLQKTGLPYQVRAWFLVGLRPGKAVQTVHNPQVAMDNQVHGSWTSCA